MSKHTFRIRDLYGFIKILLEAETTLNTYKVEIVQRNIFIEYEIIIKPTIIEDIDIKKPFRS